MKKFFLLLYALLLLFCCCGCQNISGNMRVGEKCLPFVGINRDYFVGIENQVDLIQSFQNDTENPFFFPDSNLKPQYMVRSTILDEESMNLLILEKERFENGVLYELRMDYDEDFWCRYYYEWDRCCLGYLYVNAEKIYFVGYTQEEAEGFETEADILENAVVVCQEEERPDELEPDERGWHEYILADGDRREYHGYATWGETNFYMHFYWERGKGLVEYTTGWGAESMNITLTLYSD